MNRKKLILRHSFSDRTAQHIKICWVKFKFYTKIGSAVAIIRILKNGHTSFFPDFVGFHSGSETCTMQIWLKCIRQEKTMKHSIMYL
jgi:hypothetical protein